MAFSGVLKRVLAPFVIPWMEYNATRVTLSDGDQAPLQAGPRGGLADLEDLPGTTKHALLTVATYDPPLRSVWCATAGTFSFKGPGDTAAVPMPIDAGEKITCVQIAEITSLGGLALYGGQ